jgi:hypothetical protein
MRMKIVVMVKAAAPSDVSLVPHQRLVRKSCHRKLLNN